MLPLCCKSWFCLGNLDVSFLHLALLRLARSDLKFRLNVRDGGSKGAFKYMVHVDAQINLPCFCKRQKNDRTSLPHNHLQVIFLLFFFTEFHQTDHVLYHSTLPLCQANIIIDVCFILTVTNGHTLVTQNR